MKEIIDLENRRFKAMTQVDTVVLDEVLSDDLVYTHSTARVESKSEFIASLTSGQTKYESVTCDDVKVRRFSDTAVVTGSAWITVVARGNQNKFQVRFTDVYAKQENAWRMVSWQSTRMPD